MPNKHAAIKDVRKSERRAARNVRLKTHVKALTKRMNDLIKAGSATEAKALSGSLQQIVAKAAKNHLFHPNKAAHRISATQRKLNALTVK